MTRANQPRTGRSAALTVTLAALTIAVTTAAAANQGPATTPARTVVAHAATTAHVTAQPNTAPDSPRTGGASMQIGVRVPAATIVRVNNAGIITEAMTNTGAPPNPTDTLYAVHAGTRTRVTEPIRQQIATQPQPGDWTATGTWHPWHATA